jgi:hypothetical protein
MGLLYLYLYIRNVFNEADEYGTEMKLFGFALK